MIIYGPRLRLDLLIEYSVDDDGLRISTVVLPTSLGYANAKASKDKTGEDFSSSMSA